MFNANSGIGHLYQPYDDSATEDEEESSSSGSDSSSEEDEQEAHLSALDQWRAQGAAWIARGTRSSRTTVPEGPGRPDTGLGMWNTNFEVAEERRVSVLMLDSQDRDPTVYPYPTSLRLKLPRAYRNVERIDICQVKFLNALYAIAAARANQRLWFTDPSGNGPTYVDLSDGTYTVQQLVQSLGALLAPYGITVSFSCTAGRFVFASAGGSPFSLLWTVGAGGGWTEWGLGWILGFGGAPMDLSGASSYMASYMPRPFDDYIFLRLNDTDKMNDVDHTDLEDVGMAQDSTGQVGHYFGKLLLNQFGCWSQTFIEAPKQFRPVLGRLERLNVDWVDRHGNSLAVAGRGSESCDWHMTVRITELVEGPTATSSLAMARHAPGGPPRTSL